MSIGTNKTLLEAAFISLKIKLQKSLSAKNITINIVYLFDFPNSIFATKFSFSLKDIQFPSADTNLITQIWTNL